MGSVEKILDAFRNREYNILLGTQMVAKGHDFPGVRLVGIVGADSGLGLPDFRNTERLFQLLSQTAGRAGRVQGGGKVLVQTLNPDEPVMRFALQHDFSGFAEWEIRNRGEACYPPFCKLVEVSFGSKDESLLREAVGRVEKMCRAEKSMTVMGPSKNFGEGLGLKRIAGKPVYGLCRDSDDFARFEQAGGFADTCPWREFHYGTKIKKDGVAAIP